MAIGLTSGGVFISQPLAIVVIGGPISSTVLVPVLYEVIEKAKRRRRQDWPDSTEAIPLPRRAA